MQSSNHALPQSVAAQLSTEFLAFNFVEMKSLSVLAFLLCLSVGYGLKCYGCVSTKSWDDCEDVKKEVTCSSGFVRCFKGYANIKGDGTSVEGYEKGCLTQELCSNTDKIPFCKGKGECKINCCSGDLCNAAATQMVSAIILIACALAVMIQ